MNVLAYWNAEGGFSGGSLFAPSANYTVINGDGSASVVNVSSKQRPFAWGGNNPITWPTGNTGIATAVRQGSITTSATIEASFPNGFTGNLTRQNQCYRNAYNTGEALTSGKCRSQYTTYGMPTETEVVIDMALAFGSGRAAENWALTTSGTSPCQFWEFKASSTPQPIFNLSVDTDSTDNTKLEMFLSYKPYSTGAPVRLVTVRGLDRHKMHFPVINAYLTRDPSKGFFDFYLNGVLRYSYKGFTIAPYSTDPTQQIWGIYMYNDATPASAPTRVIWWKRNNTYQVQGNITPNWARANLTPRT